MKVGSEIFYQMAIIKQDANGWWKVFFFFFFLKKQKDKRVAIVQRRWTRKGEYIEQYLCLWTTGPAWLS
jgi:hypothetical protein